MKKMRKVLIVDRSRQMRENLISLLKNEPVELFEADSAEMALDVLRRASFDVILTDTELPNKSGHHLLREVRGQYPNTEVIFVTHNASSHNILQGLRNGVYDFLVRPIDSGEILEIALHKVFGIMEKREQSEEQIAMLTEANEALEYRLSVKEGILQTVEKLARKMDIQDVLSGLLDAVTEVFEVERGFVALVDRSNDSLVLKAGKGVPAIVKENFSKRLGGGITEKLVKTNKPLWVAGAFPAKLKEHFNDAEKGGLFVAPGMLCAPLTIKGRTAGAIVLTGRKSGRPFTENDLRNLIRLVEFAAAQMEKSGIIHHLKSSKSAYLPQFS